MRPAAGALLLALMSSTPVAATPDAAAPEAAPAPAALDAEALWDSARRARDIEHDPAAAAALMRRIVTEHPDSRPAERARAALEWLDARPPAEAAELLALQGPDAREGRWLYRHRAADAAPLVAVRHALDLDPEPARALLDRHAHHPRWGYIVQRAIAQRLYTDGHYIDAWRAADTADDPGRRRAALRMMAWRTAAALAALAVVFFGWLSWRRWKARRAT